MMFENPYYDPTLQRKHSRVLRFDRLYKQTQLDAVEQYPFDNDLQRKTYISNHQLPQVTFEKWDPREERGENEDQVPSKRKLDQDDEIPSMNESDDEIIDYLEFENAKIDIIKNGYESIPIKLSLHKSSDLFVETVSFTHYHCNVIGNLLHISLLRKQWHQAQTCFALLIRVKQVDIKSIWPLGLEILTRLEEEKLMTEADAQGIQLNTYQCRVLSNLLKRQTIPPFIIKLDEMTQSQLQNLIQDCNSHRVELFINWLRNFYGVNAAAKNKRTPLVWGRGSKYFTPWYFQSLIWFYLVKFDFKNCQDLLQELLLQPPFSNDGSFHYLLALCYQIELHYNYDLKLSDNTELQKILYSCVNLLNTAKRQFHIEMPVMVVEDLYKMLKRLDCNIELESSSHMSIPSSPISTVSSPPRTPMSEDISSSPSSSLSTLHNSPPPIMLSPIAQTQYTLIPINSPRFTHTETTNTDFKLSFEDESFSD